MFCMLLRKHLEGYILEDISQSGLDRMIIFDIKGRNEIGDPAHKQLIVEIMGRHSNIILIDKTRNMILDSIKHVSLVLIHTDPFFLVRNTFSRRNNTRQIHLKQMSRMYCVESILMLEK